MERVVPGRDTHPTAKEAAEGRFAAATRAFTALTSPPEVLALYETLAAGGETLAPRYP